MQKVIVTIHNGIYIHALGTGRSTMRLTDTEESAAWNSLTARM
jgi:hypothetical protein